ncbi:hypothetical protein J2X16_001694 [Pelomonas aquatica]|uniref:DNA ligase D polymerase domain-containing protein n=1 Tax=Pelomonas aquatica TaxID=431058 RepID=A0ABU1Z8N5_9BURK|nr:hypothetical protein [Pelomonas aquatica]
MATAQRSSARSAKPAVTAKRAGKSAASAGRARAKQAPIDVPLARYNAKRDFTGTAEPEGRIGRRKAKDDALRFVIQKHWASRLHYDFRLELDGVMVSWVDNLRNGHGQTTAAAFSARARPGLGVSVPISWDQLGSLKSGAQWTITTAREYLSFEKEDPWRDYWKSRQTLAAARKLLQLS